LKRRGTTPRYSWDVFICHASEDKHTVARPLANELSARGLRVWIDESEIRLGDSLRDAIDMGLAHSQFGVVILSVHFFAKDWAKSELDGLITREINDKKIVLPVWHKLTPRDVRASSPILAGRFAVSTEEGLPAVARKIEKRILMSGPRYHPGVPIFASRLTKKVLLSLPAGSFLMSNLANADRTLQVAEAVPDDRELYWKKLRNLAGCGKSPKMVDYSVTLA
jgi:TIR domain